MKAILLWIWQFPQNLLAILLIKIFKMKHFIYWNGVRVYKGEMKWGVSLGDYILLGEEYLDKENETVRHEYGHCVQSLIFGPLYLVIVGIPSISMNILSRISIIYGMGKFADKYYDRWPEDWADKLGGVMR
jgi:hypothetical protein